MNGPLSIALLAALTAACATTPLPGIPTTGTCGLDSVSVLALGME